MMKMGEMIPKLKSRENVAAPPSMLEQMMTEAKNYANPAGASASSKKEEKKNKKKKK